LRERGDYALHLLRTLGPRPHAQRDSAQKAPAGTTDAEMCMHASGKAPLEIAKIAAMLSI